MAVAECGHIMNIVSAVKAHAFFLNQRGTEEEEEGTWCAPGGATMFNVSNNSRESSNELND